MSFSIEQKIANKPTIPVFFPWMNLWETDETELNPYSLIWHTRGLTENLDLTTASVDPEISQRMTNDSDTVFLISEPWHYYDPKWLNLSEMSPFYTGNTFQHHVETEYPEALMINFRHPDYANHLATRALSYKESGFDGLIFDWWHKYAGNGISTEAVDSARVKIASAIRDKVGSDFILMGNVNNLKDDPTAEYLSGVFMELYKQPGESYPLTGSDISIERFEELLIYWNDNLANPRLICFEPWQITRIDPLQDRNSEENIKLAKFFTAMALVIPDNGYILYSANNMTFQLEIISTLIMIFITQIWDHQ